ncbi:MAG: hypothetical protein ACJZ59_03260 [Candidatus Thalassarchaeaceae archaeon]
MLDMGFWPDISWIVGNMPERSQTLLFSATFPPGDYRCYRGIPHKSSHCDE